METMLFSEICANKDGCCLVRHEDTVYKVKVIFGLEVRNCNSEELHLELEQVFRAVLHLARSDKHIPPIYTHHLMIKPLKKHWAISDKIGFRLNGEDLQTSTYFFQFHVSERPVWNPTQDKVLSGKKRISTNESLQCPRVTRCTLTSGGARGVKDNVDSVRNHESVGQQTSRTVTAGTGTRCTRETPTGDHARDETESGSLNMEIEDRGTNSRQPENRHSKSRESGKQQTPSRGKGKNMSSDDDEDGHQLVNRRSLRSARVIDTRGKEIGQTERQNTRKHTERSAVTELSQSGVTDLDITGSVDSVPTNQEEDWRKKRKDSNPLNVNDITGFSYKVNRFRAKISGRDNLSGKNGCHALYRAGRGSPIMELPDGSPPGETTETTNKPKGNRPSNTGKTLTMGPTHNNKVKPVNENVRGRSHMHAMPEDVTETTQSSTGRVPRTTAATPRMDRDGSSDSHQQSTTSTDSQHSSRSSNSPKGLRASPAKDAKIFTRSVASSKGHRGRLTSATPAKGHRGRLRSTTSSKGQRSRGRMRSATPSKGHRSGMRSTTLSKGQRSRGRTRSATPSNCNSHGGQRPTTSEGHRGGMRSVTPSVAQKVQLRSGTSSKGHSDQSRSATPSKRRRLPITRSPTPSEESDHERLLKMRQPLQHGIQVADVDRYLVEQEELHEMSKLQEMASTHDQQNSPRTRSRKRSGLWNFVDSLIITPAKKMFKRM